MATITGAAVSEDEHHDRQQGAARLMYVDDRALSRDCIGLQLAGVLPEFGVAVFDTPAAVGNDVEFVRDARCAIYHAHSRSIEDERVLRDINLLHNILRGVRIVLLSDLEMPGNIIGAMRHGVAGYIPMSFSLKVASEAIRLVLAGGIFVPACALPPWSESDETWTNGVVSGVTGSPRLTPRQTDVLRHLCLGKQNKTIAHELQMSEGTVKLHVKHIMKKLNVRNRTQVVLTTHQLRWVPAGSIHGSRARRHL